MAQYNEILEGGLNQVIVKRLGMQTGTAVPAVQPEMTMDLTLESDRPEWGFLKGEYRYIVGRPLAAPAAGIHAGLLLENPLNSGVLVVIEKFKTNVVARVAFTTAGVGVIGNTGAGLRRDGRQPLNGRVNWAELTTATANLPNAHEFTAANVYDDNVYILSPGLNLYLHAQASATAMTVVVAWRERPVLPGELG